VIAATDWRKADPAQFVERLTSGMVDAADRAEQARMQRHRTALAARREEMKQLRRVLEDKLEAIDVAAAPLRSRAAVAAGWGEAGNSGGRGTGHRVVAEFS
jgi:hypothetical protein